MVSTDNNNNVYLAGWSGLDTTFFNNDKSIYVANNGSLRNSFLVKYNSNGVAEWAIGAAKTAMPNSVSTITTEGIYTSYNYFYLTGWWNGDSLRFGNHQITATDNQNMFVAKFDLLGNNLWLKSLGSEGNDYGNGLDLDSAENVYVVGTAEGNSLHYDNNVVGTSMGGNHASIFKINPNGNFLTFKQPHNIPLYGTSFGNAIAIDDDDNVYMTGGFSSSVAFGNDTLTSTGNPLWQDMYLCKLYDNPSSGINAATSTPNHLKIYPNPTSESLNIDLTTNHANEEIQVSVYSLAGNLVKQARFQGKTQRLNVGELENGVYIISVHSNGIAERQKLIIQR